MTFTTTTQKRQASRGIYHQAGIIILFLLLPLYQSRLYAQTGSPTAENQQEQVLTVTIDSVSTEQLVKHYSLNELWKLPKGLDSENLAFWISIFALIISLVAFVAELITARNTANAPYEGQLQQFEDLIRHYYRNMVCTKAMRDKFWSQSNKQPRRYPSEIHFLKLKSLPEDAILPINNHLYPRLHELKLLIRNYNEDIDVALRHIVRADLQRGVIDGDFDNLLYKPFSLIAKIVSTEDAIARSRRLYFWKPRGMALLDKSIYIVLLEHFIKLAVGECYLQGEPSLKSVNVCVQTRSNVLLGGARAFEQWMSMFGNTDEASSDGKAEKKEVIHTRRCRRQDFIRYMRSIRPESNAIAKAIEYLQTQKKDVNREATPSTLAEQYKQLLNNETWDIAQIMYFALHIDAIIERKKTIRLIDYEKA